MTKRPPPRVCIVDAFSSGMLFAPALRERGIETIHVCTMDPIIELCLPWDPDVHAVHLQYRGDVDATVKELAALRPIALFAGCETSVIMADVLSERLGLPSNGTAMSNARRNKRAMQQALVDAGVRSIPSVASHDWAVVEAWLDDFAKYPVVVKPTESAATDLVSVCASLAEAKAAFERIVGARNILGLVNNTAIVQQFMKGTEYIVNSVSYAGHHLMTDWWRLQKVVGESPIYEYGELMPLTGVQQQAMWAYACDVLDALAIKYGPVHCEIMLTDDGPVLIEANCRMIGGKVQIPVHAVQGFSQTDVSVDAYVNPERFVARLTRPVENAPRHLSRVDLISTQHGKLVGLPRLDEVRRLRSYFDAGMYVSIGGEIHKTVDLHSCPGFVDLIHEDPAVIDADYRQIRAWEADDFYRIAH